MFARKDLNLEWLEIAGVTPDLIRGRNDDGGRAMTAGQ